MMMRCRLWACNCVKETRSQVLYLTEKDEMYEEELLEAESEQNGTAEQEEQTAASEV